MGVLVVICRRPWAFPLPVGGRRLTQGGRFIFPIGGRTTPGPHPAALVVPESSYSLNSLISLDRVFFPW